MKIKTLIGMCFITVLIIASCKKEGYLNRLPLSSISPQNFFKNESDLQVYCNQYYSQLPEENPVGSDATSDNMANQSLDGFLAGTYTIPVSGSGQGWDFSFIRTCNFFLANYQKAALSDNVKNIYVGETLFFRANDFWKKVKTFGDVPYINKYIIDTAKSVLYGTRMPHKQVMDSVLKDLNFAVDHLPATAPDGRLDKYCALALKARICLWEGTYRRYANAGDETVFLQQAADAAEKLMASGKFKIYTTGNPNSDYYNLFIQEELRGNPETILAKRYLQTILTNGYDRSLGESGLGYSKDFVRSYLCKDGLPTSLSPLYQGDDTPDDEVKNRDPRYPQTIATRGFDFLGGDLITLPRIGTSVTSTGYQPIKGRSSNTAAWIANASSYDTFIFRYAETLLIDAEARAELGTCDQGVLDATINQLRDRVGMPHMTILNLVKDPKSIFPALPVLIDEIRRERRIELASEGFRFDDLLRWRAGNLINNPETILGMKLTPALRAQYPVNQVASIKVNSNNYIMVYPNLTARNWNDKMYLYPIPIQQLTLNPNLKQNPGW